MNYADIYRRLLVETAIVVFLKKDGNYRVMLATRNMNTSGMYYDRSECNMGWHDSKCNINNGNIAVIDLIIGEARMFNIDRVINIEFLGEIKNVNELNEAVEKFKEYKEAFESTYGTKMDLDM